MNALRRIAFWIAFVYTGLCGYFLFHLTIWQALAISYGIANVFGQLLIVGVNVHSIAKHLGVELPPK
jgi:hypothetical protein